VREQVDLVETRRQFVDGPLALDVDRVGPDERGVVLGLVGHVAAAADDAVAGQAELGGRPIEPAGRFLGVPAALHRLDRHR